MNEAVIDIERAKPSDLVARCPFKGTPETTEQMHQHIMVLAATEAPKGRKYREPRSLRKLRRQFELPDHTPKLITNTGKPRAGKDVMADYTEVIYGPVERMAFSDAMTAEANAYFASEPLLAHHRIHIGNKSFLPYRQMLQLVGIIQREADPQHFVKILRVDAERMMETARLSYLTGARVESDLEFIKSIPGSSIGRIVRPGNPYKADSPIEDALDHLPDEYFDFVLLNDVEGRVVPFIRKVEDRFGIGDSYESERNRRIARMLGAIDWRLTWGSERRVRRGAMRIHRWGWVRLLRG